MSVRLLRRIKKFIQIYKYDGFDAAYTKTRFFLLRKFFKPKARAFSLLKQLSPNRDNAHQQATKIIKNIFSARHNIAGYITVTTKQHLNFSGAKVVLLAHWDPDAVIDPYVKYFCHHMRSIGTKVVICTAGIQNETKEYDSYADAIVHRGCGGYDFTSWKAGFEAFPALFSAKEVTLCNDSVFSPIGSYSDVYATMEKIPCDFWGLTASTKEIPHIQSYHLVLREETLRHQAFKELIDAIPINATREEAIEFELRLGLWLEIHNLRPAVFITPLPRFFDCSNPTLLFWDCLINWGCPIFKRELLLKGVPIGPWWDVFEKKGYPQNLLMNYFYRLGIDISQSCCLGKRGKDTGTDILAQQIPVTLSREETAKVKLAVIIHCYYINILEELISYIENVPRYADIYISTDTDEKCGAIKTQLEPLKFASLTVKKFPNKGWDIAPFFVGFRDEILSHEIILKIHAKASTHIKAKLSSCWRTLLYSSLMGSKEHVRKILATFIDNHQLGIIAPPTMPAMAASQLGNQQQLGRILDAMDISIAPDAAIDFPVGTMFWARRNALAPIQDLNLSFDDFDETNTKKRDSSLAHALERAFFFSCVKAGFRWGRIPPAPYIHFSPVCIQEKQIRESKL